MDEQANSIVQLMDEHKNLISFEHVMTLDYDGKEYVVLAPLDDEDQKDGEEADDEVVILRVEQDDNGDDYYASIDDDNELEEVFSAVTEIYEKGAEE